MKTIILSFVLLAIAVPAICQEATTCEVVPLPIQGKYTGACSNKKANGQGKSVGMDTYEGNFKNGYPDGEGTYTWSVGDYYKGNFKKGAKQGKGEMHFLRKNNTDSIVTGFWKKDTYIGLYENPYEFNNISTCVTSKSVRKLSNTKANVTVRMESGIMGTAYVNNYIVKQGVFSRTNISGAGTKAASIEFQNVEFPFKVEFTAQCLGINSTSSGQIEITFFESGEWYAEIML